MLKDASGQIVTDSKKAKHRWKKYTEILDARDIKDFIKLALWSLSSHRLTAIDDISTERCQATDEESVKVLTMLDIIIMHLESGFTQYIKSKYGFFVN